MAEKNETAVERVATSPAGEKIALYLIGGAIAYFGVIKPLMEKLGVTDSETDQKDEKKGQGILDPKDSVGKYLVAQTFLDWKKAGFKPAATILGTSINTKVDEMIAALSVGGLIYKYDASAIIAVIQSLPSRMAVAQLAYEYNRKTGRDLATEIQTRLTKAVYGTEGAMTRLYDTIAQMK